MKYVRLLNVIRAVAFVSGLVAWSIGLYRQHQEKHFGGWPAHAFILCWGIAALTIFGEASIAGKIGGRYGGSMNRQKDPVKFWIFVGIVSVAGVVAAIVGASKIVTDLSGAS